MSNLRYYYQVNSNGTPVNGSNLALKRKPISYGGGQRYVEYLSTGSAYPCCPTGGLVVTSVGRKHRYYVKLRVPATINDKPIPISGSLQKFMWPPKGGLWQEVIPHVTCATTVKFNAQYAWTGTSPKTINILTLLGVNINSGATLVESGAYTSIEGHMTLVASTNGQLVITKTVTGTSHTDTINLHYVSNGCTTMFRLTMAFTHS